MTTRKYTFERTSHFGKSFLCAAALFFCVYAILPLSISADLKKSESLELTRIYSVNESVLKSAAPEPKDVSSSPEKVSVPSHESPKSGPEFSIDYAGCELPIPRLSFGTGKNFEITGFAPPKGDFKVEVFDVSELDSIPRRISKVRVKYPPEMLRRGIEGLVRLNVTIDQTGSLEVESVAESTNAAFEASAIEAARNLKYEFLKKTVWGFAQNLFFLFRLKYRNENFCHSSNIYFFPMHSKRFGRRFGVWCCAFGLKEGGASHFRSAKIRNGCCYRRS